MASVKFDFCGYATKNDLLCADGRTIRRDAFKENDQTEVPLVWNHRHDDPDMILGHALLQNRKDGVYMFGKFNSNDKAITAKELLHNGDIKGLSIYANQLKQDKGNVLHGCIKEVSLVLAGANPGALIDMVLSHSDDSDGEVYAYLVGEEYTALKHSDDGIEFEDYQMEDDVMQHSDDSSDDKKDNGSKKTLKEIYESMSDEQKWAVESILKDALSDQKKEKSEDKEEKTKDESEEKSEEKTDEKEDKEKEVKHSDEEGDEDMAYKPFEGNKDTIRHGLSKEDYATIFADAKRCGSLKDAVMQHAEDGVIAHAYPHNRAEYMDGAEQKYGMTDIDYLFPEAKTIGNTPDFIKRKDEWVSTVMNGTHKTPFSRVKSIHADITADEARARGYTKGKKKIEEVFTLLKRTTTPQTIYKKQKLDRDDIIDITDFDVVSWIRGEMRAMLEEEIARAILVGDGRSGSSDDKIFETNVRPIWTDDELYAIHVPVEVANNATDDDKMKAFIRACIKARKDYRGSGNPVMFTTEDTLTDMLLIEDGFGRSLYPTVAELATKLRVSSIVTVPVMENLSRTVTPAGGSATDYDLAAIIVNLDDYNVGADKGGQVTTFSDFDIDYNQEKYLIETRISGALVKPKSAMVLEFTEA